MTIERFLKKIQTFCEKRPIQPGAALPQTKTDQRSISLINLSCIHTFKEFGAENFLGGLESQTIEFLILRPLKPPKIRNAVTPPQLSLREKKTLTTGLEPATCSVVWGGYGAWAQGGWGGLQVTCSLRGMFLHRGGLVITVWCSGRKGDANRKKGDTGSLYVQSSFGLISRGGVKIFHQNGS